MPGRPRDTPNTAITKARDSRDLAIHERNLLIKALIAATGWPAHLEPLKVPQPLFPFALCVHTSHGQIAWTISEADVEVFADLPVHAESHYDGARTDEKLQRLRQLGQAANVVPEPSSPLSALLERFNRPTVARIEHEAGIALGTKLPGTYYLYVRNDGRGVELERAGRRKPVPRAGWFYAATLEKK